MYSLLKQKKKKNKQQHNNNNKNIDSFSPILRSNSNTNGQLFQS